jgi:hypothetical protein
MCWPRRNNARRRPGGVSNIFVRFFVPEQMLAKVHYGERVKLLCDSCPAELIATISFISPQAEYTPPVIYSETSRAKLVNRIERPPAQQASLLNPANRSPCGCLTRTARDDGFRH